MTTPPDAEAVARIARLLTDAGDKAFNRGDTADADLYAHAAACAAFVAALDAGEIELTKADYHEVGEPRNQFVILHGSYGYRGVTIVEAFARFRAAQDHTGGSDDGQ